ncbi:MAG: glutamine--fructose-6-phosphate transaminase (isomerizing), partial [Chloroflexi bacterium]|nr:glutamine--fructose-6-phosphate transaminase (isomerizing) [Chloroflexota bacterium]
MCGIVGYIGEKQAQPVLLNCLYRLEYRGYDSCGVAVAGADIQVFKDAVRVKELTELGPKLKGVTGIAHTRWATHGEPSRLNAHPHCDCSGKIAVVHNGIIANFRELKQRLAAGGHKFISETDSEVIPHLVEEYYEGDLENAVTRALAELAGSYAVIVLMPGERRLVAARKDSPLIIGVGDRENFVASDVPAILDYTDRVIYLEDDDIAVITTDAVRVKHRAAAVERREHKISWTVADAQKSGYDHFMLKEIHEQPKVIRETLAEYIASSEPAASLSPPGETLDELLILACGTSYHAGLVGKYIIESLVGIPVRVELASEFNYFSQTRPVRLALAITQSGETADVLKSIRRLKQEGSQVIAVTNAVGSTVTRLADQVVYTRAGPEISVAATKSFIAELIALYWLALPYSRVNIKRVDRLVAGLRQLPVKVQQVLDAEDSILGCARELARYNNVFFVGRGINFPVALEGALKLKEVSYIHAEGYAAGELKHGPFALLGEQTPAVAVVAPDSTYEVTLASIKEIKARRSPVFAIAEEDDEMAPELADIMIKVPASADPLFSPVLNTVALQLLAYHTARLKGCSI